jgi:hypothetical protein
MKDNWQHIEKDKVCNDEKYIENIIKKWEEESSDFHEISWETKIIL